ncbi:polysaccharide lyase 6 family protein [Adhaeretor mobilis]|uniref:Probable pectate lyase C n=1 Tax=Adhaeretor mobilis TaxID=1930276 RepID=A0A517MYN7_9BACT|nr:polysaccharide lyase 6 family protein [Adhaeretor mobilis]QDS99963.1 Chondroitinase-B precursor [Adhaeretor mobilis]
MRKRPRPTESPTRQLVLSTALVLCLATCAPAADFFVSSASEITSVLNTQAGPGDTLIMTNGTWTNQTINFSDDGTSANPITLRAETPGGVILNGNSTLNISGDWLVVDGLRFEGGALNDGSNAIVEFRGNNGEATNSRFTNSAIVNYNPTNVDDRYHWLEMFGQNNRVDNNRFEGQNHSGVTVVVRLDDNLSLSQNHQIDRNHFVDRPEPTNPSSSNGFETIRIGTSARSMGNSNTVVENNLFERTEGEVEIISNKSGSNTYRYNTFRESAGTLTLRHGNDTLVEGNFFLGENKNESGGIRVIGERQTIVNNYIANVDDRAGAAISISAGVPNSELNQYFQVKGALIAHNTIVNTLGNQITFDDGLGSSGRTLLAEDVTIANNLLRSSGATIFEGNEGANWTWEGNIAFGGNLGPKAGDSGISVVDPQLQLAADGLWRPNSTSPAINAAQGDYSAHLIDDMDGQPRIGVYDVGADEFSMSTIVRKPLSDGDVGPSWITDPINLPSGGGCGPNGCAIQAEDYDALLDPDNNSLTWTVENVAEALGGEVLKAPSGNRTDLPSDTHDAIAVFDVTFEQAGTYKAYYRARGFSGSSDSIFTPDDFGTDPDNQQSLSSDGEFLWEIGDSFTISSGEVDVPLEFRIGRREGLAELDALVLNLDANLTPSELDALFDITIAASDFDEDGDVDADDLAAWQTGFGTASGALQGDGDGNEDGAVNGIDFLNWQLDFNPTAATAASSSVPEPSSLILLICLGVSGCLKRGQRHPVRMILERFETRK